MKSLIICACLLLMLVSAICFAYEVNTSGHPLVPALLASGFLIGAFWFSTRDELAATDRKDRKKGNTP